MPAVTIAIDPINITLPLSSTKLFKATVTGTTTTNVIWSVNGIVGGNATVGTIDATGNYKAPAALPAGNPVTVKATSVADQAVFAVATVTLSCPTPTVQWFSPG